MGFRLWVSGALAVVGGTLMVLSGYVSRGLLFFALGIAEQQIPNYLTGFAEGAAILAVTVLELLIALGGITILVGGLALFFHHVRTGRVLISLGGGAGLLGLLVSFGYTTYRLGPDQVLLYAPYWLGLAMAVGGSRLSKGA